MTKKLEINFTKKPEIVFQFDQFLNVEQAVDKFLNKKENLKKLIAPLIPTNLEETIQKLIPEVSDGYTPQKGVDYDDGKDGETPSDEKIIALIKPQIPKVIPGKDGTTPKKGIDYFTKKELDEIKKELKTTILSEMPEHATKEEVNIKITEVLDKIRKLPTGGGGAQFLRQLMDVNVGNPTAQQYGLTYNPSRGEFALTAITGGGGGAVDSVNGQTGVVVLDADDIDETASRIWFTTAEETKLAGIETGAEVNTIDTVSDTSEIDLTITARALSASIVAGSIDETKLDTSVNASLDLADTALQSSAIGVSVQAYSSVLQNTTASFTTTDETKLDNITVTQAVNLDTMESDIAALANGMVYKGNWDASAGTFPGAGSAQTGWFYTVSVGGTVDSVVFNVDDRLVATTDNASTTVYAGNWTKLDATDAVTSIFSRTGNVVSANGDYTASQITNVPAGNIAATDVQTALNELDTDKQATLVSGTNIKTVNSTTLLGSGDIAVATTAQGALADSALQPGDIASGTITARADDINFSGGSDGDVLTVQADGSLALEAPASGGANTALSNLSGVAINTSLVSDTDNTDDLGTTLKKWANLFVTTIGATGTRITKLWATDIESTNIPTVGGTAILSSLTAPSFTTVELGHATDTTISRVSAGDIAVEGNTIYRAGGTDVPVTDGGTGRSTSTTAYGLIAAGTTATGAHQTLATGSSGQILRSGGASALPAYSTATYPDTAGTSGNVLQSDGTNFVSTTLSAASYTSVVNSAVSSSSYMTYQLMPTVGTTVDVISNGWEESNVVMTANQGGGGIIFYDITAAAGSFIRSNMPGYGSQSFFRFADIASNAIVAKTRIKMLTGPGATEAISWGFNAHTFLEDSIEAGIRFCIADNGGDKLYAVTGDASNNKNTDVTGALTLTDWLNLAMVITSSQVLFYAGNTNALTLVATHSAASSGYIPTGTAQMKIGWGVAANNTPEFYFTPTIISLPTA